VSGRAYDLRPAVCRQCFRDLASVELGPICGSCDCVAAREADWLTRADHGPPLRIENRGHPQGWCVIHVRSDLAVIVGCADQGMALSVLEMLSCTAADWTLPSRDVYRRNRVLIANVTQGVRQAASERN
jgi:hypothetical protein